MENSDIKRIFIMTEINITEPVLLIRTSKLFKQGMSAKELYEITRGVWKIGSDREKAEYAFCVADGIVRKIYKIQKWQPAGTAHYETRAQQDANTKNKWLDRWEFIGEVAPDKIRNNYIGKSVAHYFKRGNANPINYVNIKTGIIDLPTADSDELEKRVAALLNVPNLEKPEGVNHPERREQKLSVHERDPKVKAWIIKNANGKCECCGVDGFIKEDGNIFLEVHHLRLLAENGSDTLQNAVALCANCHRKLHYAKNKEEMRKGLIKKIDRLQEE
jgi:hypothetical protein